MRPSVESVPGQSPVRTMSLPCTQHAHIQLWRSPLDFTLDPEGSAIWAEPGDGHTLRSETGRSSPAQSGKTVLKINSSS